VEGCFIGTDPTGNVPVGNGLRGIGINASGDIGTTSRIGGILPSQRNVISANFNHGVFINSGGASTIQGNYIGTNADGNAELSNGGPGIYFGSISNVTLGSVFIGGGTSTPGTGAGNVISGNLTGISIEAQTVPTTTTTVGPVTISGNIIGLAADGATVLGNDAAGVEIQRTPTLLTPLTVEGNVIAANGHGIINGANGAVIEGNFIGTDITGTLNLGNQGYGIFVDYGHMAITENIVANNGLWGIEVPSSQTTGVSIRGNSIYSNAQNGIDLGINGLSLNDVGDFDTGANDLQNFPVLTSATSDGVNTTIAGTLDSFGTFTLEFFANAACDSNGHGEGATLLGSTAVSGVNPSFGVILPIPVAVGQFVTSTATSAPSTAPTGNTSEFSACVTVTGPPPPPPVAPVAPTGLTAAAVSATQINLAWTDHANNEDGFKIERCNKGKNCSKFVEVAQVGADAVSFSNAGLSKGTNYRYRVRAFNAISDSAYSNIAAAKTPRR
jgi:hypothetical protein